MDKSISETKQRQAGTWQRNEFIRAIYRPRLGGVISGWFEISRQAVNIIVRRPNTTDPERH